MNILFYPSGCLPFHGDSTSERPLGGTESAAIYLAQALEKLGHSAIVISSFQNPPLTSPIFLPHSAIQELDPVDVMVAVREWQPVLMPVKRKLTAFWTGDAPDQPQNLGLGDWRVAGKIDRFLAVSEWAKKTTCQASGFPLNKSAVLRNGINPEWFSGNESRNPKRLIYSSTPYRGLALLPEIYTELKRRHPDLELHIFSGYDVYTAPGQQFDQQAIAEFNQLKEKLELLPDCTLHGNVTQQRLAKEYLKSSILAYPNTFAETSCITAMEAQAAGCPIVTSNLAALPETVGRAGILIDRKPGTPEYTQAFIESCHKLLSDQQLWQQLSATAVEQSKQNSWEQRAREFVAIMEAALAAQ